ncbi:MAG TPA: hypothetical protein VKK79_25475 [Candidatus Lokiarchaeia archaeon]|nr:hypothetical protein [Candidatus Lokiarchaeia archaeon]
MEIAWDLLKNPILDKDHTENKQCRDGALFFHDGVVYLYYCTVEYPKLGQYQFYTDLITSTDLIHWTPPHRLWDSLLGFSSPGNVFQVGDKWVLCVQTYPIERFHWWGSDSCRVWTSESSDLLNWTFPKMIAPGGSAAHWAKEKRQIDPFILPQDGKYWCFYKTSGKLGLLVSEDLENWEEASPDRPIFAASETPDHTTIENACVLEVGDELWMFFSPCYNERGIGISRSPDLFHWKFDRYLKFPKFSWAKSGPTAPSVLDLRAECGKWVMEFHAERRQPHHAAMGLAWSDDLMNWNTT